MHDPDYSRGYLLRDERAPVDKVMESMVGKDYVINRYNSSETTVYS